MAGFENPLWKQIQKIELTSDGTLKLPVKANGKDGIVMGDPPLFVPPALEKRPGLLSRLLARRRGRRA